MRALEKVCSDLVSGAKDKDLSNSRCLGFGWSQPANLWIKGVPLTDTDIFDIHIYIYMHEALDVITLANCWLAVAVANLVHHASMALWEMPQCERNAAVNYS